MDHATAYPATAYAPPKVADLSSPEERARLSGPALRSFFQIMQRWGVKDEEARRLLGGMPSSSYYALKKRQDRALNEGQLLRISYLLGMFRALHMFFGADLADRWMRMPNRNPIFQGDTPLNTLLRGGLPTFQTVRQLLDAYAAGNA